MPYFDERRVTGAERLSTLKSQAEVAQDRRDRNIADWQDTYNYFRTDAAGSGPGYQLQVNFPFAWYESMWPSIVYRDPVLHAEPLSPESEESAPTVEAVVSGELRNINFKSILKRASQDALLYGVGLWTLGYYSDGLLLDKIPGTQEETPATVADSPPDRKKNSDLPYGIRPGQIYTLHIRPNNFYIDPDATCMDDAMYCGIEYVRDWRAVKDDPQYKNTSDLAPNEYDMPRGMEIMDYRAAFGRDPVKTKIRLCQHYDMVDRKIYVFSKDHDKLLGEFDMILPVRRFPIYVVRATDDNETFWCQGPMEPWLNLVEEYNTIVSRRLDHLDRFKRKYLAQKGSLGQEEMAALMHPEDGTVVEVESDGQPINNMVAPLQDAPISQDSYAFTAEVKQRWTEISGTSEFDLGGSRPGERPAAEINRISGAANARRSAIADRFESTLGLFAEDVRAVMEKFYSKERAIRITGDRGETIWAKYDGSALAGQYLWKCSIEEMAASSREERLSRAAQALQVLSPYSQAGPMPMIDIRPQLKKFAKEFGVRDLRFLPETAPLMDPGQEWYLMLRKGVDLQPNEQDNHDWHIFTHERQLVESDTLKSPSTIERLQNHIAAHAAMKQAQQMSMEGAQQAQQRQGAPGTGSGPTGGAPAQTPGPAPGSASPNPNGGGNTATGQNLQSLLRGGFQG